MRKLGIISAAVLCASVSFTSGALAAESCALKEIASLNVQVLPGGGIAVPVTVGGAQQLFLVELSAAHSAVVSRYADSLKLDRETISPNAQITFWGQQVTDAVRMPDMQIGKANVASPQFMLLPSGLADTGVVGVIGLDILGHMDVELDLARGKLNLFSQDHCKGQVVYWGGSYAAVPFDTDPLGTISFAMSLDGHNVNAEFAPSFPHGRMSMNAAARLMNVSAGSAALSPVPRVDGYKAYAYPFKSLSANGITVTNPHIDIVDRSDNLRCDSSMYVVNTSRWKCLGGSDVIIGLDEMRKLHMYFAFGENTLYITGAGAHS